jgi:hypothetical protein
MRFILIIFIFLQIISCRKKESQGYKVVYYERDIQESLKPFLFSNGSYWIYSSPMTSNLDSVIVFGITRESFNVSQTRPDSILITKEIYYQIFYRNYITNEIFKDQVYKNTIARSVKNGGYTFLADSEIGTSYNNAQVSDIIDTLIVEGNPYLNVVKMKVNEDNYIQGNFYFYYADSIGIVRKEILVNDTVVNTWNLLRYNVVLRN